METIRQGVQNYADHCKSYGTDKQYISHGDTWFGNRRWTDEYEMKGANNGEFGRGVNGTNQAEQTELVGEYW
jgi:hypothetical protein